MRNDRRDDYLIAMGYAMGRLAEDPKPKDYFRLIEEFAQAYAQSIGKSYAQVWEEVTR